MTFDEWDVGQDAGLQWWELAQRYGGYRAKHAVGKVRAIMDDPTPITAAGSRMDRIRAALRDLDGEG